jgi:ribosomal-protein-alanine N-acetyltransferase
VELVVSVEQRVEVTCALRRATGDDAERFVAWRAEPSVREFQPVLQLPVEVMRQALAERAHAPLDPEFAGKVNWVILANGEPAGWVSITVVNRDHAQANAGYTISEAYRGHRLAGRALRLACEIAFDPAQLALQRIEANCTVTNIASAKTLEYAGFTQEGIARGHLIIRGERVDHFRYGRLYTDPAP